MRRNLAGATALAVSLAPAVGWATYAAVAWLGYGRLGVDRRPDTLLDRFMPAYEVTERHELRVAAPASLTYAAAREFDLMDSPVIAALFRGRELMMGASHEATSLRLRELTECFGWRVLAEEPGREIVLGTVTKPWEPNVVFHGVAPERFAQFDEPGYAQIAWTLAAEPIDERTSVVRTLTRVRTTDSAARARFRRYWAVFSPGIALIRRAALRSVRREAERRVRAG
ncbi:MAG: hypothetical protein JOZ86_05230 [Candidatus Eremiobacteraeota bacterium]|nr:hypothetical protein [Candidatus Eremiobacteraeota bacterium]